MTDPKKIAVLTDHAASDGAPVSFDVSTEMLRRFAEDAPPRPELRDAAALFYDAARQAVPALLADREEMLAVLRDAQWAACDLSDDDPKARNMCPECCARRERGHATGCRLAALLGSAP